METITTEFEDGGYAIWNVSPEDMDKITEFIQSLVGDPDTQLC